MQTVTYSESHSVLDSFIHLHLVINLRVTSSSHPFHTHVSVSVCPQRLFEYISGTNEEEVKVDMTAPVRVMLEAGQGPFCKDHFKMSFFVPLALQASGILGYCHGKRFRLCCSCMPSLQILCECAALQAVLQVW